MLEGVQSPSLNGFSAQNTVDHVLRRPWTKLEEDALFAGLDKVNGPYWTQILALYGRGGSISEALKDRTPRKLRDKARNLELRYLNTGKEVPTALRGVAGALSKRAGPRVRAALGMTHDVDQSGDGDTDEEDAPGELVSD